MSRRRNASEFIRDAQQKRAHAISRLELGRQTVPRVAPASPISAPIKAVDPEVERLKAEYEAKKDSALATRKP